LPDGKKVKAGEFYAKLNDLEKKLNDMGHSLRDNAQKVVLHESILKKDELAANAKKLGTKHRAFDAKTMKPFKKRDELVKAFKAGQAEDKKRVEAVKKLGPGKSKSRGRPTGIVKPWGWELGRRKIVAAYFNAKLELRGDRTAVTALGEANAGAWMINH